MGYVRGDHEPWMVEWFSRFLRPGGTFVDVGAHLGYFTLIAAEIVGPKGCVIAFEPDPRNAAILEANVVAAGKRGLVEIVRAAVGAEGGLTSFLIDHDYCSRVAAEAQASVEQVPLDSYDIPPEAVIKVDVEGHEIDVLLGARSHLEQRRATWIIEVHGSSLEEAVVAILRQYGYTPEVHAPVHPVYADYRQRYVVATRA
jgi:FkbM family methyltransferase